jgi:glycosyltransferase involved in cell wall biosynthesis
MKISPLSIFVHRASECLTDHESHGDGLICFSLLNGLAQRGHQIFAYANTAPIRKCHPNLVVKTARHRVPANSLAPYEHAWRADRWLKELAKTTPIDLVWRMHPYGVSCPTPPQTDGRPLVVGPLFYNWPKPAKGENPSGQPRFGVGLGGVLEPLGQRGWDRTLQRAALILCATEPHTEAIRAQYPNARVETLPVIIDTPDMGDERRARMPPVRLLFIANLVANKRPQIFCETIKSLRDRGIPAEGVVLGDGPERGALEAYCAQNGMNFAICFTGKVPNMEVFQHLRESHFLVSTSHGEPYGRGIAEAMAVGTPAVCHRSGGPADFVADGEDGLLVDKLTGPAYAARIAEAIQGQEPWKTLSNNARCKAQDWRSEVVLTRLEEMLTQVASTGKGTP